MTPIAVFHVLLLVISPVIGSFLAVLVDRLPRGQSVVMPRSACRACDTRLRARDLVPVLSFALSRGRCRHCAAPIPPFTLYTELLAIGAALLAILNGGDMALVALNALWLWLLIALAMTDLLWFRLPDLLTGTLAVVAWALAVTPGGPGLGHAAWGVALGAGSFALIRWAYAKVRGREGLGLGDVKLMIGLGAFAGPFALPHLVLFAALFALAGALATRHTTDGMAATRPLPFGTALCAAAALLWLMRAAG
ncbi:A24 family peptidase [uncultured Tateyamaria sp.]|uniref:prepilin peptidase n=1 Tax=uncultured Tateyamaria sp. TaxID=455651 RepID=UPI002629631B|nr:A24 family peptidase [uncultured Tateyamaria sp.]